jgi:hypothetical protein
MPSGMVRNSRATSLTTRRKKAAASTKELFSAMRVSADARLIFETQ